MEENMLSVISNGGDHVSTGGSDSSSVIYPTPPSKHVRHGGDETHKKFKGVVPQQNGNWGAQIYANNQRVWLGTFKSEKEAAMAYDSAAIQLRYGDSHRNFPWTSITVEEPNFQRQYSKEDVLDMIKDGSYQPKFAEFLRIQARARACYQLFEAAKGLNLSTMQKRGGLSYKLLFEKELTPSDVGKLNRLVIPKKDAITYFPDISERVEEDAQASGVADMQLGFFDRMMRSWRFRYCYWKSSQSFVFTRGWSRFVKDKQLKANDVIAFYLCELKGGKAVETFFMIDFSKGEESGSSDEGADHNVEQRLDVSEKKLEEEMMEIDPPSSTEKKGFRLFGVQII